MRDKGGASVGMRVSGAIALALAVPCIVLGCPSGKSNAPPATSASVTTTSSASTSASATVAASTSASASVTTAASAAPFAGVGYRELVAVEAWDLAAEAIDRIGNKEPESFVRTLARTRAAIGRCTKAEGELALAAFPTLRADKRASTIEGVLSRLEVDALVCAQRYDDALKAPNGLRTRDGAVAARLLARVLEATGDLKGARAALAKAIEGGPKAGLPVGSLLVWRLRLDRKDGDTAATEADRRKLYLEYPGSFDQAVAAGEQPRGHGPVPGTQPVRCLQRVVVPLRA
ncbi:MAG: hypothetical protein ABI175_27520, partial [Polyangiales bacterium]